MAKSLQNAWTYVGLIFIFAIFTIIIGSYGVFLGEQDEKGVIDLPVLDDYQQYQLALNASSEEIEDPVAFNVNTTEGTPKDFSIPFLFSQDKSQGIRGKVQFIYGIPTSFLQIFGLPVQEFAKVINLISWLFAIGIFMAFIYFIRAIYVPSS